MVKCIQRLCPTQRRELYEKKALLRVIRRQISPDSIIHSDGWRSYDGLVDLGYKKHFRINHGDNQFATKRDIHINGIEAFWGTAKTRLLKHRGIKKNLFYLHLKECEFRFNYRSENLYQKLLKIIRRGPLF